MTDDMPGAGHNSVASDTLKQAIERVERLEEEIKALTDDRKDVYDWAKSTGLDVKLLRQVIRRRKMDREEREEQDQLLELGNIWPSAPTRRVVMTGRLLVEPLTHAVSIRLQGLIGGGETTLTIREARELIAALEEAIKQSGAVDSETLLAGLL